MERLEESGWKDQVRTACKEVVKERGLDRITVEDLVQVHTLHGAGICNECALNISDISNLKEVAPKGSQMVPDDIRKELLKDIKKFLEEQAED